MSRRTQLVPYRNDEVVLYMDEVSGTNVTIQPAFRNHEVAKPGVLRAAAVSKPGGPNRIAALRETDNDPSRNLPPSYGPEIEDFEPEIRTRGGGNEADDRRGVDDGLLPPVFPRGPGPGPRYPFDVNIYQQKKTLAQGMMDLALISANANQLRYVLQSQGHPYYLASLAMISSSLFLQIVVGIGLIWNSTYNVKKDAQVYKANRANNLTVIGIFLVTILNVFISSFGVAEPDGSGNASLVEGDLRHDVETVTEK